MKLKQHPLKRWRRNNNKTQVDVAIMLDVSLSVVKKWEQGRSQPNLKMFKIIKKVTRCESLCYEWLIWFLWS